jgi:hypothetical protein
MATKQFQVKLFQSHIQRSHTETFDVEAETIEEAKNRIDKMVREEKGVTEDYDLEVVDTTPEALPQVGPEHPLEDTPDRVAETKVNDAELPDGPAPEPVDKEADSSAKPGA